MKEPPVRAFPIFFLSVACHSGEKVAGSFDPSHRPLCPDRGQAPGVFGTKAICPALRKFRPFPPEVGSFSSFNLRGSDLFVPFFVSLTLS